MDQRKEEQRCRLAILTAALLISPVTSHLVLLGTRVFLEPRQEGRPWPNQPGLTRSLSSSKWLQRLHLDKMTSTLLLLAQHRLLQYHSRTNRHHFKIQVHSLAQTHLQCSLRAVS